MTDPTPARIGFAAPLTGDQAIVGVPMRQCAELAVEEINARESAPFRWKLVAEDDRADPRVAVDVARRFVDDPAVIGVVGHKNSGPSEAAAPIYSLVRPSYRRRAFLQIPTTSCFCSGLSKHALMIRVDEPSSWRQVASSRAGRISSIHSTK